MWGLHPQHKNHSVGHITINLKVYQVYSHWKRQAEMLSRRFSIIFIHLFQVFLPLGGSLYRLYRFNENPTSFTLKLP